MSGAGLEQYTNSTGKTAFSDPGGAKSGALEARTAWPVPDGWGALPPAARLGIGYLIASASPEVKR